MNQAATAFGCAAAAATNHRDWTPVVTTAVAAGAGLLGVLAGSISSRRGVHRQWIREKRLESSVALVDGLNSVVRILSEFKDPQQRHADAHGRLDALEGRIAATPAAVAKAKDAARTDAAPDQVGLGALDDELAELRRELEAVHSVMDAAHDALRRLMDEVGEAMFAWQRAGEQCLLVFDDKAARSLSVVLERVSGLMSVTSGHRLTEPVGDAAQATIAQARHDLQAEKSKLLALLRVDLLER
jgi:chromosome segregation ATPase